MVVHGPGGVVAGIGGMPNYGRARDFLCFGGFGSGDGYRDPHTLADSHFHGDGYPHHHADSDRYSNSNPHTHADAHANPMDLS